ncbi:MAG TPA: 16S rRNA (guanine(527)-N(7))-methyltransferase RsmG [Planctomycetes bacterium]|nr:16S rRNA (guanine(527)-N(7))-methyltransferase RsmG [Planctomycetota bacterium]
MCHPPDNLNDALAEQGIRLREDQVHQLDRYCRLLWDWNTRVNLTRHTDYRRFVTRDVVDTLVFADHLEPGERILDVGTGGGVPGVVLAIIRPDLDISLSESVGKRARAVADIVRQLGLRAPVHEARAESLLQRLEFNTLVARAVARLPRLLRWLRPHWDRFDRLLLLKGPAWVKERGEARHHGLLRHLALRRLASYPMPGDGGQSVLLQICPKERMLDDKRCRMRQWPAR